MITIIMVTVRVQIEILKWHSYRLDTVPGKEMGGYGLDTVLGTPDTDIQISQQPMRVEIGSNLG